MSCFPRSAPSRSLHRSSRRNQAPIVSSSSSFFKPPIDASRSPPQTPRQSPPPSLTSPPKVARRRRVLEAKSSFLLEEESLPSSIHVPRLPSPSSTDSTETTWSLFPRACRKRHTGNIFTFLQLSFKSTPINVISREERESKLADDNTKHHIEPVENTPSNDQHDNDKVQQKSLSSATGTTQSHSTADTSKPKSPPKHQPRWLTSKNDNIDEDQPPQEDKVYFVMNRRSNRKTKYYIANGHDIDSSEIKKPRQQLMLDNMARNMTRARLDAAALQEQQQHQLEYCNMQQSQIDLTGQYIYQNSDWDDQSDVSSITCTTGYKLAEDTASAKAEYGSANGRSKDRLRRSFVSRGRVQ